MFRFKRSIPVSYEEQKKIYYHSLRFDALPEWEKKKIHRLCRAAGGEHAEAVMAFVTGRSVADAICRKYYISRSTLERKVRKYYLLWKEWESG